MEGWRLEIEERGDAAAIEEGGSPGERNKYKRLGFQTYTTRRFQVQSTCFLMGK